MYQRDYEYIIEVAKTGSILKASKNLCISSSALSKHILKIEENLKLPLFERSGKTFTLTYAGERYLAWAQRILELNQEMEKEMKDILNQQCGMIRLGCPQSRASFVMESILPEFRRLHPKTSVALRGISTRIIEKMLINHELDLIFVQSDMIDDDFQYIPICEEEQILVINREHPLSECGEMKSGFKYPWIDLRRFANDEFVVCHPDQATRQITEEEFKKHKISPPESLQIRNIDSCIMAVVHGLGSTIITTDAPLKGHIHRDKLRIFSFGNQPVKRMLVLKHRKTAYISTAERDLIELFQRKCKE